jgi:hypothetical protein
LAGLVSTFEGLSKADKNFLRGGVGSSWSTGEGGSARAASVATYRIRWVS